MFSRTNRHSSNRVAAIGAILVALIFFLPTAGAFAQSQNAKGNQRNLTTPEFHAYLTGAVWSVVLHEAAHALIDVLDPVITGPEEDVADEFAAMLLLREARRGTEKAERIVKANAEAKLAEWRILRAILETGARISETAYMDEHSLDPQRAANILCLLYGAFPDRSAWIITELFADELAADPDTDVVPRWKHRCPRDYERKQGVWQRVLEPFIAPPPATSGIVIPDGLYAGDFFPGLGPVFPSVPPTGRPIFRLEYADDDAPSDRYYERVVLKATFETALAHLSHQIALPHDVPVIIANCGESNAFYIPEKTSILFCHELIDDLADAYVRDKTGLDFETWWQQARTADIADDIVGYWRLEVEGQSDGTVVGEDIQLGQYGGYDRWLYEMVDGTIDENSVVQRGQGLWGFTPHQDRPGIGEIWIITQDGLRSFSVVWWVLPEQLSLLQGKFQRVPDR